jgi:bacillithiol biosynthesis cysteine-adding enzyme BshC
MKLSEIGQFSQLVKDYVGRFNDSPVKNFFLLPPGDFSDRFKQFATKRSAAWATAAEQRATLVKLLGEQHESNGTRNVAVQANLDRLGKSNAVAIVTGQQVGIFGGPLYSLYKILTTIKLAARLHGENPSLEFVPVFWLETEDHDIEEATSIGILDRDFTHRVIRYEPSDLPQPLAQTQKTWRKQIGPLPIESAALEATIGKLIEALQPTEFTEPMIEKLRSCYDDRQTFGTAFAKLLDLFFAEDGLLVLDANDATAKQLAEALFKKELSTSPQLSETIIHQTAELEEHYHGQVKPRALNFFYLEGGERYPLVEKEGLEDGQERAFFLQPTKRVLTQSDLLSKVAIEPERFSPNVVLRPLYQDMLLPTVAYVAGPGEIAYFAQFKSAYQWAGIPMPVIEPRLSATIVEDRFQKLLEKQGLNIEDILSGGREKVQSFLDGLSDAELAPKFEAAMHSTEAAIEGLRENVSRTDATLGDALSTLKGKLSTAIRDFLAKTLAADRKRHANVKGQFEKLLSALMPRDSLQERELSIFYFINKYGFVFWGKLKQQLLAAATPIDEHIILKVSDILAGSTTNSSSEKQERTSEQARSLVAVPAEESA